MIFVPEFIQGEDAEPTIMALDREKQDAYGLEAVRILKVILCSFSNRIFRDTQNGVAVATPFQFWDH